MLVSRNVLSYTLRKSVKSFKKPNAIRRVSSAATNILDSGLPDIEIPKVTLPEFMFSQCEKYYHFTAAECGISGLKYTYGDLIKKSKNLSKTLRKKLKLNEGDVIAILMSNNPNFAIATLGALEGGLIVTTINPIYTKEEISRQLTDSSAKAIITLSEFWNVASASCELLKKQLPIIVIKAEQGHSLPRGTLDFGEFINDQVDFPEILPRKLEDVAILPYSSGTTGLPKGVQLTHYNLLANLTQNTSPNLTIIEEATNSHQDVVPVILPMFHIYGFNLSTMCILSQGAKSVTLPKFTTDDYVALLRKHRPHVLFLVPPIVLFLSGSSMVKRKDLESVRTVFCGAAPLGALDEQRLIEKAGKNVHMLQGYGLTEASPGVTVTSVKLKAEVNCDGSIGKPLCNTLVKIVDVEDKTGTPLGANKTGELLVKGPQLMKGYLNKPEETKNTFLDGWLRTGDTAYYNEERVLFITDRMKELIKVKGFQVAPAELEEIIRDYPNVEDAAVIGVPHPRQGEAPRAYIVPKKNTKIDCKDLEEYVKSQVAEFKQLKGGVAIVESIPKNASGKIMRRSLKLEYEKTFKKTN